MVVFVIAAGVLVALLTTHIMRQNNPSLANGPIILAAGNVNAGAVGGGDGLLESPYVPPLKTVDIRGPPLLSDSGGWWPSILSISPSVPTLVPAASTASISVPVPIATSVAPTPYRQIGILTHKSENADQPTILPLMGRNLLNGRDKWQYYTMSNSNGAPISTKLPINVKGKSGLAEYGIDSLDNGEKVFVDGYQNEFKATLYDNASLLY